MYIFCDKTDRNGSFHHKTFTIFIKSYKNIIYNTEEAVQPQVFVFGIKYDCSFFHLCRDHKRGQIHFTFSKMIKHSYFKKSFQNI